jgi:hypothetical protein
VESAVRPGVKVRTHFKTKGGGQSLAVKECTVTKIKEGDTGRIVKVLLPSGLKQKVPIHWIEGIVEGNNHTQAFNTTTLTCNAFQKATVGIKTPKRAENEKKTEKKNLAKEQIQQEQELRRRQKKREKKRLRRVKREQEAEAQKRRDMEQAREENLQRKKERCALVCMS